MRFARMDPTAERMDGIFGLEHSTHGCVHAKPPTSSLRPRRQAHKFLPTFIIAWCVHPSHDREETPKSTSSRSISSWMLLVWVRSWFEREVSLSTFGFEPARTSFPNPKRWEGWKGDEDEWMHVRRTVVERNGDALWHGRHATVSQRSTSRHGDAAERVRRDVEPGKRSSRRRVLPRRPHRRFRSRRLVPGLPRSALFGERSALVRQNHAAVFRPW